MQKLPSHIELSSLPIFKDSKASVELSLSSKDEIELKKYFNLFTQELELTKVTYKLT